jgi:hypothetical protein
VGTAIRYGPHDCYHRLVIEFGPHGPGSTFPGYEIKYTTNPVAIGQGPNSATIKGTAVLRVRVNAWMHNPDGTGYAGSTDIIPPTESVFRELRLVDDFEAVQVWAVGLDRLRPYRAFELDSPARLVIDVFTG